MIPEAELDWSYARAGGPGGQNVNKVSSKAVLRWNMAASTAIADHVKRRLGILYPSKTTTDGEVVISSQEYRDQERNRESCRTKLAAMIEKASILPRPRVKTKASKASKTRRLVAKKRAAKRRNDRSVGDGD